MAKLLYIVSLGHSGSTILDLIAGTLDNVFSMGEVQFLSWQLLQGPKEDNPQTYCSCGKSFDKCKIWKKVLDEIGNQNKINIFNNPKGFDFSLNRYIVRYKNKVSYIFMNKLLSFSLKYRAFYFLSNIVYLVFLTSIKRNWELFDRTSEISECKWLVDSSKDIRRFWLLWKYRKNDVKLIILRRNVKGVATSSHHGLSEVIIEKRAKQWINFYYNSLPKILKLFNSKNILNVEYEEICRDSNKVRIKIAKFLNLKTPENNLAHISPYNYHTIQGNPIRLSKVDIKIRCDDRWQTRISKYSEMKINKILSKIKE